MDSIAVLIGQSAAIIAGISAIYKFVLVRPLEKSEAREEALQKRYDSLASEVKRQATRRREIESLPPPRDEQPTLDAVLDLYLEPAEAERRRQQELNPGVRRTLPFDSRQDYTDHRARNAQHGLDTPTVTRPRKR